MVFLQFLAVTGFSQLMHDGFYGGIGMGSSFNQFELEVKNTFSQLSIDTGKHSAGFVGNIFAGYGHTTKKGLYLGGEMRANFFRKATIIRRYGVVYTGDIFENRLSVRDYFSGDFLMGLRPADRLLFYARAGGVLSQINLSQEITPSIPNSSFSDSNYKLGGRVGLGFRYGFSRRLGLGMDFVLTQYGSNNFTWEAFDVAFTKKVASTCLTLSGIISL